MPAFFRGALLNIKCSMLILLSWTIGLGTFAYQLTSTPAHAKNGHVIHNDTVTKTFSLDPIYAWPLKAAVDSSDLTATGLLLAIFATLLQTLGFVFLPFIKPSNHPHWALVFLWQGFGALMASSIGKPL